MVDARRPARLELGYHVPARSRLGQIHRRERARVAGPHPLAEPVRRAKAVVIPERDVVAVERGQGLDRQPQRVPADLPVGGELDGSVQQHHVDAREIGARERRQRRVLASQVVGQPVDVKRAARGLHRLPLEGGCEEHVRAAERLHPGMAQERRGIVVSRHDEDGSPGLGEPRERLGHGGAGLGIRLGPVEDVPGDEHRVRVVAAGQLRQLPERVEQAAPARQGCVAERGQRRPDVDVGEVQDSKHSASRYRTAHRRHDRAARMV